MITIATAVIILLWVIPYAFKAKVKWPTIWRMLLALVLGGIPVVIGAVIFNSWAEARWVPALGLNELMSSIASALFTGFGEEGLKLIAALISVIGLKNARKIDYIIIFGMVGAGFEIIESIAFASDLLTMAIRVFLALHVVWLFYNGAKYYETKNGKGLSIFLGYIVTAIFHAAFDMGAVLMRNESASEDIQVLGFILTVVGVIINVVFIVRTTKMVGKAVKE